jgi:hypothetical protein
MKIEIELDEETAACIWANRNPAPKIFKLRTLAQVVQDAAEEDAAKYRALSPGAVAHALAVFREANKS